MVDVGCGAVVPPSCAAAGAAIAARSADPNRTARDAGFNLMMTPSSVVLRILVEKCPRCMSRGSRTYNAEVMYPLIAARFIFAVLCAFLLGSLPFSVWVGRRAGGVDVREHGTRNPGAANVWRTVGRVFGVLVGAADA